MGQTLTRILFALCLILPLPAPGMAEDGQELRVIRVTPEGKDVPATRQIVVEFNRPVVPVGDMARKAEDLGITITPPVECDWRWLNTTSLSCNLGDKEQLQKATSYKLRIEPKIAAEDGAALADAKDYDFITERPVAGETDISVWSKPGSPALRVSFNQPVTQSSSAAHVYFEDAATQKRYEAVVTPDENDAEKPSFYFSPDKRRTYKIEAEKEKAASAHTRGGEEARTAWMVSPKTDLPLNAKIVLKQEPGLVSFLGDEPGAAASDIRQFYTFPEFSFKGVACYRLDGTETLLTPGTPQTEETLCDPMRPVNLAFSAPVLRSQIRDNLKITPDLSGDKAAVWGDNTMDWSRLGDQRSDQTGDFRINFPIGLKAAQGYTLATDARPQTLWQKIVAFFKKDKTPPSSGLADEFGRGLPPFSFQFATGHRNPNYELVYRDAVLEKGVESEVPLYVNNLKNFSLKYQSVTAATEKSGATEPAVLPDVKDKQYAVPVGVREILGGKSGALYGRLTTDPAAPNKWEDAGRLFAQVTPYQIYAKLGHFRSSVWVTDLATGDIVPDAKVTLYEGQLSNPKQPAAPLITAQTDANGLADLPGLNELDPDLSLFRGYRDDDARLFVRVDKGEDMALLPVSYDYEVQLWNVATDVYEDTAQKYGHMKSWGMTAQGIYRAGDTMQYKIYVRDQDNNRFIAPPDVPYTLEISDPTGKNVEKKDVTLSAFGTLDGEYVIPKTAAVGWYSFKLTAALTVDGKASAKEFYPLSVLVSDFTPAPFRVATELNGDKFKAGDTLDIDATATLHSGGPFGGSAVRSTITLRSKPFASTNPKAKDFIFNSFEGEQDSQDLLQKEDKLGDNGELKTSFVLPQQPIVFGQLVVESAVRDERGKSIASEARADYVGVDRLVGLNPAEWVYTAKKPATVRTMVVDAGGNPVADVPVDVKIEKETVSTAKVKGAGNAYLNDNTVEWVEAATCDITSGDDSKDCTFTPGSAGTYRMTAAIKDTKGRDHKSQQILWVSGDDYVQWNEGREYALTILPEQNEYKVGDTARYLVKNPYPGVNALVTVERYGVLDSFMQKLEGSAPVIEIPVKADYVPGFYLSVVAMSPRVDTAPPEMGQVDMGKPAFRVGYVKTGIIDPYKTMTVTAMAEKELYRPRDTVKVSLDAKPLHDQAEKEPVEMAVAVLDESVFDLIADGKNAFDPYHGFYELDSLDVSNYSLLTRLLGRQKFEKKGANPGGDGGVDAGMRNLFKFVSYWNPSVPLDENGHAEIEFPAPDNLTGWRVLALATTPTDRMGLGEANFKVNRPTEIRPVMPNQVREGDLFTAGFSVMNRTDQRRTIKLTITAGGDIVSKNNISKEELVTLDPYKRATVLMPLEAVLLPVTRDKAEGLISFSATAGDEIDSDGLEHPLPVYKARTLQTAANYATMTESAASENIAVPKDIYTDSGDISVVLSPSVIAGLDGAFKYMRDYPYPCWEQKLTSAVMASHYKNLKSYLDDKTTWDGADTLTAEILQTASSYQAPNGGMTYFVARDEYADPYLSAYTALSFQWLKKAGYAIPPAVEEGLEKYLLAFLRNDSAPDYYQDGMTSTVRAVILAAYKDSGQITQNDVLRFRGHVKDMSLFGKAHYLQAASAFPETADAAREALGMILSSGVESGGKFSFNETYDDGWDRILATPLRDNCAVLDTLLTYPDQTLIGDKPFKLVRMITQGRGNRDHWENTQENMFCMNAMIDYAQKYETEPPRMKVTASYEDKPFGDAAFTDLRDKPVTLARPLQSGDEGSKGAVRLMKDGGGRLYYATRLRYAAKDLKDPVNAGIDIRREYSIKQDKTWVLAKSPADIKRGDLVRVDLYLSLPTARSFVVVDDPLPGGLETVNTDLATASKVDAGQAPYDEAGGSYWFKFSDWNEYNFSRWSFYHKELRHDSARFYADWLEPGNYHLSYMAQAIAGGTYAIPPVRAEEMYDPDIYGVGVKGQLVVEETD